MTRSRPIRPQATRTSAFFSAAVGLALLGACNGVAADLPPEIRELRGPDRDNNGLQDDVDAFIREHAKNEDERLVLEMYAHKGQDALEAHEDEATSLEIAHRQEAQHCLYTLFGFEKGEKIRSEMFALAVDSEARTRAYFGWESHLGGQFFRQVDVTRSECITQARETHP